jgi:hypothetical protein
LGGLDFLRVIPGLSSNGAASRARQSASTPAIVRGSPHDLGRGWNGVPASVAALEDQAQYVDEPTG